MNDAEKALRQGLIGAWLLESWEVEYGDGRITQPFGADAHGLIIYAADGWMSATMSASARTSLDAATPAASSLESRAAVFAEYLAYGGRWSLQGETIVHRVTHSVNPVLIGTSQRRDASLVGDALLLQAVEPLPRPRTHRIRWRRASGSAK
ncbi:MAG: lipocalin-like domain-containing protein [Proteobacteria bacterium]|nr:lipocalin-like domain-containing protein [Pseudomonadota bacterium]